MVLVFNAEKDVETYLRKVLEKQTKSTFTTAKGKGWQTDGILTWQDSNANPITLLLEAKFNKDLTNSKNRSFILAQALYYCDRLQKEGKTLPNVILIGDENFCFLVPFNSIQPYLNFDIDWSRPPSDPDPKLEIYIDVYLYKTEIVKGSDLKLHSESLAEGTNLKLKPSRKNISAMYQYWVDHIFPKDKYSSVEKAHIFYTCICYSETDEHCAYSHPTKKNTLVIASKEYQLNIPVMNGFFQRNQRGLSAKEIDNLVSMRDRIIEDDTRRRQGAFYTPALWVDEAHSKIDKALGQSWKEDCIVWDCCAGTGNLTRDYDFSNLILSTAENTDIQVIKREDYNEDAQIFQYDFLNPNSESPFFKNTENTLPVSVKNLLKNAAKSGKRIVFLINPPYVEHGSGVGKRKKNSVAKTEVNKSMLTLRMGISARQLYTQFLYQCEQIASTYGFENKTVGIFCKPAFITTSSFSKFREFWYSRYSYQTGFLFKASHFANVSGAWGVSFTLWNEGATELTQELNVSLKDIKNKTVTSFAEKKLYSAHNREASSWVVESSKSLVKGETRPCFSSGLKISNYHKMAPSNHIGCFVGKSNVMQQNQLVFLLSEGFADPTPTRVLTSNESWRKAIALYSARKLVKTNWINDKDEYLAPQTTVNGYEQWVDDCHIYALIHNSNNMTAMRGVEYKGQTYNIHNHFFWLTRDQALNLYGNNLESRSLYRDAKKNPIPHVIEMKEGLNITPEWRKNGDPYFSHILPTLNLSPLALEIFQDLNELFVESFALRKQVTHVNERGKSIKLHLNSWDAGVYQHKKLWYTDPTLKLKWEELRLKHKQLSELLQNGVYKYGFLK